MQHRAFSTVEEAGNPLFLSDKNTGAKRRKNERLRFVTARKRKGKKIKFGQIKESQ